uniref:C2H2-type domain-containing protein n=1 Tax=Panagrellus redivivus TaxID=6233 RepID=A0A7E4UPB6_PANRE
MSTPSAPIQSPTYLNTLLATASASSSAASSPEASTSTAPTTTTTSSMNQNPHFPQSDPRVDEVLLPALLGHEALPIHLKLLFDAVLPSCDQNTVQNAILRCGWTLDDFRRGFIVQDATTGQPRTTWRTANLPTTLQILNLAKSHFGELGPSIDGLRTSLTQTILVNLLNAQSQPASANQEMPTIASLAPHEHGGMKPDVEDVLRMPMTAAPSRRDSLLSAISGVGNPSSPDTDAISVVTDSSGDGMSSGGKSLRSLKNLKKRVLCEKCHRTFCDKGALKIHNSSVHLREMHMCTVPGCTKQFPSKRSRNRHSNNPKMHTDAGRRRNCRTTIPVSSTLLQTQPLTSPSNATPSEGPSTAPEGPSPQVFAILQRFMAAAAAASSIAAATSEAAQTPQNPIPSSILSCLNNNQNPIQQPQPSSNQPDVSNLLKIMIAQRQKIALC